MLVMTAKLDKKKAAILISAIIVGITALILLLKGGDSTPAVSGNVSNNDSRVAFLKSFGWDVTTSPVESGQVRVPTETTEVYSRYNALQKSQGYDLTAYAGKTVMRYVYEIKNYPGATEPVYATVLVYKNQVIGGDVTDTGANGIMQGFKMTAASQSGTPTESTAPTVATTPSASLS